MAVTVAELLAPAGPIDGGLLFPGETPDAVRTRLDAYLQKGAAEAAKITNPDTTQAQRDDVTRAYAVWRAYDAVVDRIANTPSSFSAADEGSVSFSGAQLRAMQSKRDAAYDTYAALVVSVGVQPVTTGNSQDRPTSFVPVRFYR